MMERILPCLHKAGLVWWFPLRAFLALWPVLVVVIIILVILTGGVVVQPFVS